MLDIIVVVAVVFTVVFGLIMFVLTGRSRESARLMEVTSTDQPSAVAPRGLHLDTIFASDRVAKLVEPMRGLLGSKQDPEMVRRLAAAGYRLSLIHI